MTHLLLRRLWQSLLLLALVPVIGLAILHPAPDGALVTETVFTWPGMAGLAITLAVTSFNFAGDGLRDALDPRMELRRRQERRRLRPLRPGMRRSA